jgi:hypothetical protein
LKVRLQEEADRRKEEREIEKAEAEVQKGRDARKAQRKAENYAED